MSDTLPAWLLAMDGPAKKPAQVATIYDRSTIQRWAECPHQAWLLGKHKTDAVGIDAVAGEEVHKVISRAMHQRQHDAQEASDIREWMHGNAEASRPDVQPMVVQIIRKAAYVITNLLCYGSAGDRHPDDLMIYDGGEGDRSGQLAWEVIPATKERPAVQFTGEVDLLLATASAEEVELQDWKSGWRHWTAGDVLSSFQFQSYAWLIFQNFEAVNRIIVKVWNLREGDSTSPVTFERRDMVRIEARIRSAARLAEEYRVATEAPPAWPMIGKCELCPVAAHCDYAKTVPDALLATDPAEYLKAYSVTVANADRMKGRLSLKVRADGKDFVADGLAFGVDKPKASRAKPCDLYEAATA